VRARAKASLRGPVSAVICGPRGRAQGGQDIGSSEGLRRQRFGPPDLGHVHHARRGWAAERQPLAQTPGQNGGQRGGRQIDGIDLVEDPGKQGLLFGRAGAGDQEGVLHPVPLLQHRHRHRAAATNLHRRDQALRADAVRQAGSGAMHLDGECRGLRTCPHLPPDPGIDGGPGRSVGHPFAQCRQQRSKVGRQAGARQ